MTLSTAQIIYFFPWFLLIAQLKQRASLSRLSLLERAAMKPRHAAALAIVGSLSLRARGETHMNFRHSAVILSVLVLALSVCAQQLDIDRLGLLSARGNRDSHNCNFSVLPPSLKA